MRKAGFLFVTSVFAILVAGVAHADIASTNYVDNKAATEDALGGVRMTTYRDMVDAMNDALAGGPSIESVYPDNVPFVFDARDVLNNNVTLAANKQDAINPSMVCETDSDGVAICDSVDPADIKKNAVVTINSNGTVVPTAPGAGLTVDDDGVLSVKAATTNTLGGVKIGSNISVNNGKISVPKASREYDDEDGNMYDEAVGVVSGNVSTPMYNPNGDLRERRAGFYDGVLHIPLAQTDYTDGEVPNPGLVRVASMPWDEEFMGEEQPSYVTNSVPTVGYMQEMISDSAYTLPTATTNTLGGVKIGRNIDVNNGKISVPEATVDMGDMGDPSFQTGVVNVWSKHIDDICAGNTCAEYIDPDVSNHADELVPTLAFVQAQVDGMVSAGINVDQWETMYSSDADSNPGDFPATLYYEDGKPVVGVAERLKASVLPLAIKDDDNGFLPGAVYVADTTEEVEDIVEVVGEENLRSIVPSANLVESFLGETLAPFIEGKQDKLTPTGSKNVPVYVSATGVVSPVKGTTVPVGGAEYDASKGWATIWIE